MVVISNKSALKSEVFKTKKFRKIQQAINNASKDSLVLLDVDDTIISPASNLFRITSPDRNFIENIKDNLYDVPDIKAIVTEWRTNRRAILVDEVWPAVIQAAMVRGVPIHAFTLMATGAYGTMKSVEAWRYAELKSMGVVFPEQFRCGRSEFVVMPDTDSVEAAAIFYKGMFMTGGYGKGIVLPKIFEVYKPAEVIFVDDLMSNIREVQAACAEHRVPYTGILYRGADDLEGEPDPAVAAIQKESLLQRCKWFDDEAAVELKRLEMK